MSIHLTESRLRQIIREEAKNLTEMGPGPGFLSYRGKLNKLRTALNILQDLDRDESGNRRREPGLENVIQALYGYMSEVEELSDQER